MVRKRHFSSQVHFVTAEKVNWFISELTHLAAINGKHFGNLVQKSYDSLETSSAIRDYFSPLLKRRITWQLNDILKHYSVSDKITEVRIHHSGTGNELVIEVDVDALTTEILNGDIDARKLTANALKDVCRFHGGFRFDPDIPF
jgi:hypothetical protein